MTKEEIVSSLKEQAQEKYDSASFIRMNEGDVLMEAAKMLSAQQDHAKLYRRRWEGCSACASKCCELCVYKNFGGDDWPCNVCRDGFTAYKPVNYCPVCGRPLTEEAEAELKKREEADNEAD